MPTSDKFRYLERPRAGERPRGTLVLIHAFPLNARMWEPQLALADHGWHVIAPQLRGFDGGTADPSARSMDDYAGDVIDLLDALHVEDAVIGGLSMGGYVAFAIFRHAPRYVRALVLADTRSEADTPEGVAGRKQMLQLVAEKGAPAVADAMIPKLLGEGTRATRPDLVERVRSLILSNSSSAIAGAVQALMTREDSTPLLPTIHCPTLIVVGEEDVLTPRQFSDQMHGAIAGSELAVISKAGHLSSLEQPNLFSDVPASSPIGYSRRVVPDTRVALAAVLGLILMAAPSAQESQADAARRKTFDQILDLNVRDGYVYYRALKSGRAKLDGYVSQLARAPVDQLSRDERLAFWLNAYDALVLKTVIDHYPIQVRSKEYPSKSIRQIPGAFERLAHPVGGRMLTLDQIEQTVLSEFHDPRVYFAVGRGSVAGGRLRSEAFAPATVEAQLTAVAAECAARPECVQVDRSADKLLVSAIFSWREKAFVTAYASSAPARFADRSPIERAVIAFIQPKLLTIEREALDTNTFQMAYQPYDWTLNDLTGRGGR